MSGAAVVDGREDSTVVQDMIQVIFRSCPYLIPAGSPKTSLGASIPTYHDHTMNRVFVTGA